ncbi:50S ribosomal protein L15 [Candidatus Peregrinibacteria bacterium]|nr:50S ribosomal protein L15 [Candidatus Peregrinibacteria bacterium]
MSLLNLSSKLGKKKRKRIGRGNASGHGTYSCHGMKGQTARSGGRVRPGFEGGQTPMSRKMPKLKGFKNPNHVEYQVVCTGQLNVFEEGQEVGIKELLDKNIVSKKTHPVKLLSGKGELTKKLKIKVNKTSKSAIKEVESKKGEISLI